jgi:hypothetical protein
LRIGLNVGTDPAGGGPEGRSAHACCTGNGAKFDLRLTKLGLAAGIDDVAHHGELTTAAQLHAKPDTGKRIKMPITGPGAWVGAVYRESIHGGNDRLLGPGDAIPMGKKVVLNRPRRKTKHQTANTLRAVVVGARDGANAPSRLPQRCGLSSP